jgi:23S rRNA (adenine2030-N6)-methyltransferase
VNYRHAFHAGNFADCMKHALLHWLVAAMQRKPAAIGFLDTHAGTGAYDLAAGPAQRTGEWRAGIARLLEAPPPALADYVALVPALGLYPGSPCLIRALMRPQDRLACCELHPDDHAALRRRFAGDPAVAVHRRDAWEALGALLPPEQRRALVLIDPPYEAPDEFAQLVAGLRRGHARMGHAVFVAWYPIKHRSPVRAFHGALGGSGLRDILAAELWLREPTDPALLNGCGLAVVNPPFGFAAAAEALLAALLERLGNREPGEGATVLRLADE